MKLSTIFMISFFILGLIGFSVVGLYNYNNINEILTEQVYNNLRHIAQSSSEQVNIFLEGGKERAIDFSSDGFIKNSLMELKNNNSEKIMQELSEHLINNKIVVDESFYGVFVLDKDGNVVGTTNPEEEFGEDFSDDLIFTEGKKSAYVKDSFYDEEFKRYGIAFSAPVLSKEEFLGVIVIRMSFDKLNSIIIDAEEFYGYGQIYLLDKDFMMFTPSKFLKGETKGAFVQEVDTLNSRNCFSMEKKGVHKSHEKIVPYLDYRGEEVVGTHEILPEVQWCLMVEFEEKEAFNVLRINLIKKGIAVALIIIIILTLIGFFVGFFLDNNYHLGRRKIKKYFCGYRGKKKSIFCRFIGGECDTYPNGICGRVVRIRKFFINLKLRYYILFALVFVVAYFFVVTSFFQGWRNAAFYDEISDLFTTFILILLFFYGFKLKNYSARRFILLGSALAIIDKLIQIVLEEYIFVFGVISTWYLIPGAVVGFVGLILIFYGFKEVLK